MQTGWWGGNTLLVDFPFPAFPDNMGHWAEVLLPVYSTLLTGAWRKHVQGTSHHIDRLLLINVRRDQLQVCQSLVDSMSHHTYGPPTDSVKVMRESVNASQWQLQLHHPCLGGVSLKFHFLASLLLLHWHFSVLSTAVPHMYLCAFRQMQCIP